MSWAEPGVMTTISTGMMSEVGSAVTEVAAGRTELRTVMTALWAESVMVRRTGAPWIVWDGGSL